MMIKDNFPEAIKVVLKHEGKMSNNSSDPGGPTHYGISLRFLKASGIDVDADGDIDVQDILAMDKSRAIEIYKKCWWIKYDYDQIKSLPISTKLLDLSINMGPFECHKIFQKAARNFGYIIVVDGFLGMQTIGILNNIYDESQDDNYIKLVNKEAEYYYRLIVKKNPILSLFLKGWLNRVYDKIP